MCFVGHSDCYQRKGSLKIIQIQINLPFVVADVNGHVFMTIGNFAHKTKPMICKTTANDKNFI